MNEEKPKTKIGPRDWLPVDRRYSGVTVSPKDAPRVLRERREARERAEAHAADCGPLCPEHGDARDTSVIS